MSFGLDYSYGGGLTVAQMRAGGVTFVCRYLAPLPNSKVITRAEFGNLTAGGIGVVLVWEGTGRDADGGFAAGQDHAAEASRQAAALGAPGIPVYFAPVDWDAPESYQSMIHAYLDGCASMIGRPRVGFYGGFHPLRRAFDAGKITWGWQTYAWSGGNWDPRAHIQQYRNDVQFGPARVDYDRSMRPDFGQWPRPAGPPPPPVTEDDDMVPAWLPDKPVVTLYWTEPISRLGFFGNITETIKLDLVPQAGEPHPDTVPLDLAYGKGEVTYKIPDDAKATIRAARVVRGAPPDSAGKFPPVSVGFVR